MKISCTSALWASLLLLPVAGTAHGQEDGDRVDPGAAAGPEGPPDPVSHYEARSLASRLYEAERWAEAEPVLARLVRDQPGDPGLWYRLGRARRELGRPSEAVRAYRESHRLGYRYGAWIPYQIARLYAELEEADSTFAWLERALEAGWDDRPGIATDSAFDLLRTDPRFQRITGRPPGEAGDPAGAGRRERTASPVGTRERDEGWRRDLDYLVAEARRLHAGPERPAFSSAFDSAVSALRRRIPALSNDEIVIELQRLVALLGDGHTGIYGPDPDSPLRFEAGFLPVLFYEFEDGLFIVDAMGEARRWIGSRVVAIGPRPAEDVVEELHGFTHRDNPMTVLWLGVRFHLPSLSFLRTVGATEDLSGATLTVRTPAGEERRVRLRGDADIREFRRKLRPPPTLEGPPPLWLRNVDANYRLEPLPERDALYFPFNQVRDAEEGPSLSAFADSLRAVLESTGARHLIVDVRHNNGGNNGLLRPLVRTLVWWEQDGPDRRIFVITGRNTFSAAQNFINRVERWTDAVFVGEPSSSRPNFTGEETNLLLPFSRVRGSISNRHWQDSDPDDRRPWISPDIPVRLRSDEYFGGRDPALEAIFRVIG